MDVKDQLPLVVNVLSIFGGAVVALVVYIWKDGKDRVGKDHESEMKQREDHDDMLHELLCKIENKSDRDFEKLFKVTTSNAENIRELTTDLKNFREMCDIKRASCLNGRGKVDGY